MVVLFEKRFRGILRKFRTNTLFTDDNAIGSLYIYSVHTNDAVHLWNRDEFYKR